MKLAVLTTETTHHVHFVRGLNEVHRVDLIVTETRGPTPPFETAHPFEAERDVYERRAFFEGADVHLSDVAEVLEVESANDGRAVDALGGLNPDVVVVFGTGRLGREVLARCPDRTINLHGGDPEHYRGLDTHLWAVYHGDFDQLIATLHYVTEDLDAGDVIAQTRVQVEPGMPLHQLRARNTGACLDLTLAALDAYRRSGRFIRRPQRQRGRYYSFMPAALKPMCVERFETYTKGLTS